MSVLEIRELAKNFGDKEVLRGITLTVQERSVFGFIGRNGAGKTTTMKAVLGLLPTDGGEISVVGERVVYGGSTTNRHIGYLPDVPEFYSYMNAAEYLRFCGEIVGMPRAALRERCEELLTLVGLSDERHRIKGFSRGMKQRLGIAQALLNRPRLLICDEPTSALDPVGRKEILDTLLSVREQTTVLFSTHILSDVERICTDVALLENGKVAMQGPLAELRNLHAENSFCVDAEDADHAAWLAEIFPQARRLDGNRVLFVGDERVMFDVLRWIAEKQVRVHSVERMEPTLENLFLEVLQK
ncbi:MAG: ABC transporter ATP-binding protein [Clostridia bacterium]|nr:ABC transporter ATP-binding protein [Clostridia bacterium]